MFDKLQTRIVVLFAILFVAVQGLTSFAVYYVSTTNIKSQIEQQLLYSGNILQKGLTESVNQLADGARLLSSDFGFRAAVATNDQATILSALKNLVNRIDANSAMLISLDEKIIADTSEDPTKMKAVFPYAELIEIADYEGQVATFINENGKLYEMVITPVLAPIPVAWVAVLLEMDDVKAQNLKSILPDGIDISFAMNSAQDDPQSFWTLISSTLKGNNREVLSQYISTEHADYAKPRIMNVSGSDFMAMSVSFPRTIQSTNVHAIIQYSMAIAFSPYEPLILTLASLLGLGLVALIGGSMFISQGVVKPISELASAAKRIMQGNYKPVSQSPRKDEVHQLAGSFNLMIDGIQRREKQITHQAEHDLETGLPNKRLFEKYVAELISKGQKSNGQFCLMEIALSRFSDIRNTVGYTVSESLIKEIGPRIKQIVGMQYFIARLNTTSFILALPKVDIDHCQKLAQDVIKSFDKPFQLGECTIDVMVKIGISCFPNDGDNAEEIIKHSSIAVVQSEGSLNHFALYDASKDKHNAEKLSLMSELRQAIDNETGEIKFFYQPKIDIKSGIITSAEALIRWFHPTRGFIPPDDFIPMAEQTGHIHHLTHWCLENGLAQASLWHEMKLDLKLAINLSARDLNNKDLPEIAAQILKKHACQAPWVVLEVTESAVMQDPETALQVLDQLSQMGFTLSVDDFGTGYSSMTYLKRLPVQEIKIDKSFVQNLATNSDDEIIVRSTIDLGHNLGLKVTAEGIEDQASLEILNKHGCDIAQGYLFSKPLPLAEFETFLKSFEFANIKSN